MRKFIAFLLTIFVLLFLLTTSGKPRTGSSSSFGASGVGGSGGFSGGGGGGGGAG